MTARGVLLLTLLGCSPTPEATEEAREERYLGAEACQPCHPEAYEAWRGSAHAYNMGRPSPDIVVGDFETNNTYEHNGTRSRMYREGERYLLEYTDERGKTETYEIAYAVGILRHQTYLWKAPDGRLQILPTYWNAEEDHWRDATEGPVDGPGPTPITHRDHWQNFGRTYQVACMECHSSRPRKVYDSRNNTYASQFEPRIDCESCHGPGGRHVDRWKRLDGDQHDDGLWPLETMDATASVEVCARCHARKRIYLAEAEAEPFYDAYAPDLWEGGHFFADGRSSSLNYRYVEYMQNGCFKKTTRKMDCGYCHPPHDLESTRGATVTQANRICTGCHLDKKTRLTAHTHHEPESDGSRCVDCHMPKMDLDLRMTVRDHTIGSPLPELTREFGVPNACSDCHIDEPVVWAEEAVERWYGALPTFQATRRRVRERARVLASAFEKKPPVPELVAWLDDSTRNLVERASAASFLADARGSASAKAALLRHVEDPHPLVRYYVVRSLAHFRSEEAVKALRKSLGDPARIVRVGSYEGLFYIDPSVETDAEPVVAKARAEFRHREDVVRPDDPRLLPNRALWAFTKGDKGTAEELLRRAVAIAPRDAGFHADLAQLLMNTGRLDAADREIRIAEELAPTEKVPKLARATLLLAQGRAHDAVRLLETLDGRDEAVARALAAARRRAGMR